MWAWSLAFLLAVFDLMTPLERAFVTDCTVGVYYGGRPQNEATAHWNRTTELNGVYATDVFWAGVAIVHEARHHCDMADCVRPMGTLEAERAAEQRAYQFAKRVKPKLAALYDWSGYDPAWEQPLYADHCEAMQRFVIDWVDGWPGR